MKFRRDGAAFGYPMVRSRFGYLCVEGMMFPPLDAVDDTSDVNAVIERVAADFFGSSGIKLAECVQRRTFEAMRARNGS